MNLISLTDGVLVTVGPIVVVAAAAEEEEEEEEEEAKHNGTFSVPTIPDFSSISCSTPTAAPLTRCPVPP